MNTDFTPCVSYLNFTHNKNHINTHAPTHAAAYRKMSDIVDMPPATTDNLTSLSPTQQQSLAHLDRLLRSAADTQAPPTAIPHNASYTCRCGLRCVTVCHRKHYDELHRLLHHRSPRDTPATVAVAAHTAAAAAAARTAVASGGAVASRGVAAARPPRTPPVAKPITKSITVTTSGLRLVKRCRPTFAAAAAIPSFEPSHTFGPLAPPTGNTPHLFAAPQGAQTHTFPNWADVNSRLPQCDTHPSSPSSASSTHVTVQPTACVIPPSKAGDNPPVGDVDHRHHA